MSEEKKHPNIYESIANVMKEADSIGKNKRNTGQGYNFRGIDDVYNALNKVMSKYGVFTACEDITEERYEEGKYAKGGGYFMYSATFTFKFYCSDGSFITNKAKGKGMDAGDKDMNKAMSVAHKYALLQVFAIPTEDAKDPENDNHEVLPKEAVPATPVVAPKPEKTPEERFEIAKKEISELSDLKEWEEAKKRFDEAQKSGRLSKSLGSDDLIDALDTAFEERKTTLQEKILNN